MGFRPKPARVTSTPGARVSARGRSHTAVPPPASTPALFHILENASDVMYTHDGQGNITWVNGAAERVSGYTRDELLNMNILDLLVPEQVPIVRARWAERGQGELPTPFTAEIIIKEGSRRTLEVGHCLISDDAQSPSILSIGRDVTNHARAQRALRESEERFRAFVEQSSDVLSLLDEQGKVIYQSQSITRHLGYLPEELVGRSCFDFVHPEDLETSLVGFRQGLEDPSKGDAIVLRLQHKLGHWKSFEAVSSTYVIGGRKAGLLASFRYVGDRMEAEAELRDSEERYRQLFQRNLAGVFLSKLSGGLLDCNDSFAHIFGYESREQMIKLADFNPYSAPDERERYVTRLKREKALTNFEMKLRRRDGTEVWVLENVTLLEDEDAAMIQGTLVDITERKRAEQALAESESKFRALAESATTAIFIHNGRRFLYSNQASEEVCGYTSAELRDMSPWDLIHLDQREMMHLRAADRLRGDASVQRYELRIVHKDGEDRWLDFSATVTQFAGEEAMLCTAFDITQRKHAERLQSALYRMSDCANSVDDLGQLFEALHQIIGELMYAQNLYIALLDESGEYLQFPYFVDQSDPIPAGRKRGRGLTEYVLRTGKALLADFEKIRSLEDKREIEPLGPDCIDWLGAPLRQGSKVFGVIALQSYDPGIRYRERDKEILTYVSQHISVALARKRQEEALRASEARHRSLVESAVYGMYRSTVDGRFLDVNPALVQMLGYSSPEELLAVDMAREIYADPDQRAAVIQAYNDSGRLGTIELRWKRKDGHQITVRLSGTPFRNERGETLGFDMIAEDITERRTLEEQLRQSQKMEAIGRLAGGVAHDFNNLLTVIKGYSELVLDDLDHADPMRHEVDEIKKAADRAASLTRQLLAFSRQQVLAPKVLDLNLVVHNMDKLLHRLLGEDIDLFTVLEPGLGRVKADPGQVEQVIMNLAVNARDAMPQGGKLTIETANVDLDEAYARDHVSVKPGRYVMIAVSDNGAGMPEKVKSRIFEPFFTTKEVGKGTGLGLSTVYGIIKQSGGYIWVYSEVGRGSTFKVYLPRVDAPAEISLSRSLQPARHGSETVLLVEDEDGVRALMRQVMHKHGYNVLEARHGGEALLMCERHQGKIDMLLTDVVLQQMSGRELAERLLKLRPEMKVLYVSGYADDAIVHHGVLTAGMSFLQKPFTTEALARKIRYVLDGPPQLVGARD
jgi:two-component system, cell cycle sensor histidine kinase and response regulator CckA